MRIKKENNKQMKRMALNFKSMRQSKGWSIRKLSEISGISKRILSQIEKGKILMYNI